MLRRVVPQCLGVFGLGLLALTAACTGPKPPSGPTTVATAVPAETSTPAPTSSPAPVAPTSALAAQELAWIVYDKAASGFSISVPPAWKAFDDKRLKETDLPFSFYAVDDVRTQGVLSSDGSVSITVANVTERVPPEQIKQLLQRIEEREAKDLESAPTTLKPVSHGPVPLPAGPAIRLQYVQSFPWRAGPVLFLQYGLFYGSHYYLITFETTPNLADTYVPIFEKIAGTLKLGEPS